MVEVVINQNDGFVSITATGGETDLDFDFPIYEKSHLRIIRTRSGTSTDLVLNTDYTIADGELELTAGGTAVLATPATAGDVYSLLLDVPEARTTDFTQAGDFRAATLNRELDLQTQQIQGVRRDTNKALRLPDTSTVLTPTLEDTAGNAGLFLKVNDDEDGFDYAASLDPGGITVTAFALTLLDDASASAARATLGALPNFTNLTTETAIAKNDFVAIADTSGSDDNKITVENFLNVTNDLTEDTTPSGANDFLLTYDASATLPKKVKPTNLLKSINDLSTVTIDPTADFVPFYDASGAVAGKALTKDIGGDVLSTAQTTTSGTTKDFTGLPAGVKEIKIMFNGISLSGTDHFLIQIGDSGGIETSGYDSSSEIGGSVSTSTSGFVVHNSGAPSTHNGIITLCHMGSNLWVGAGVFRNSGSTGGTASGTKTLSAELDRVRITVTGANTFDAGSVNISYGF